MKIGILLPPAFDLGLLRRARQWSLLIGGLKGPDGKELSTAIGVPEPSERRWRAIEKALLTDHETAVVRHLAWEPVPVENARRMFTDLPEDLDLDGISEVVVPRDWGWNFRDCDALIVFADPDLGAVLPLRPTAFYCPDLAVRIAPRAWAKSIDDDYWRRQTDAFQIWRQAAVITADPRTIDDIVSYAGVRPTRALLVPNLLDLGTTAYKTGSPSFALAWLMGDADLHDLENAASGVSTYLSEGGLMEPILVYDIVRKEPSEVETGYLRSLPQHLAEQLYGFPTVHVDSERALTRFLERSGALWSSRLAGGEGEAPLLAAQAGIPFVGLDYEVNRTTVRAAGASSTLYAMDDALAIADALHQTESFISQGRNAPERSFQQPDTRIEVSTLLQRLLGGGFGG